MADQNFIEDFYSETMAEMAGNFFSRRKDMDARLEGFGRLAEEVRFIGEKALRRWKSFFILLPDEKAVAGFFTRRGVDVSSLSALAGAGGDPWRFRPPHAFTASGRFRKSVRHVYEAVHLAAKDYLEGGYANDPKNPKKKIITPSYSMLQRLAKMLNEEVVKLNTTQNPSMILAYCKSLDPAEGERENITGGLSGEDCSKIDRDMAFKPIDLAAMELPSMPAVEPLDAVRGDLDKLADAVYQAGPEAALKAIDYLTLG